MSLTCHPLHRDALLSIQRVCCRPDGHDCGTAEHTVVDQLVLPLQGVFLKHHAGGPEVLAAAGQALFFNAGEEYRVSHPAGGGDDCLTLELSADALGELLGRYDPTAAEAGRRPFRATHALLPANASLQGAQLRQRLHGAADVLEVQERALELYAAALASARPGLARPPDRRPPAARRRREQAQATATLLAAQPEQRWSLERLAQRVHASPFHLARSFHRELGVPVHRYLLRARLLRGLDAVLDSGEPLTAIALRLGFTTPSHFATAFRQHFGTSPSAVRGRRAPAQLRKILKAGLHDST